MTSDSIIRRRPNRIDPAGEPIRASAWQNLHFLKDGRSFHDQMVFETEKQARDAAEKETRKERDKGDEYLRLGIRMIIAVPWTSPLMRFFYQDYSHHIQVPVMQ